MAEVALLSLSRAEIVPIARRAAQGDPEARQTLDGLWLDFRDREIECFLCGNIVDFDRPFTFLAPDRTPDEMIVTPLCSDCAALPELYRWNRALKLFKKMWPGATFRFR